MTSSTWSSGAERFLLRTNTQPNNRGRRGWRELADHLAFLCHAITTTPDFNLNTSTVRFREPQQPHGGRVGDPTGRQSPWRCCVPFPRIPRCHLMVHPGDRRNSRQGVGICVWQQRHWRRVGTRPAWRATPTAPPNRLRPRSTRTAGG